jgi:hypothetical protein
MIGTAAEVAQQRVTSKTPLPRHDSEAPCAAGTTHHQASAAAPASASTATKSATTTPARAGTSGLAPKHMWQAAILRVTASSTTTPMRPATRDGTAVGVAAEIGMGRSGVIRACTSMMRMTRRGARSRKRRCEGTSMKMTSGRRIRLRGAIPGGAVGIIEMTTTIGVLTTTRRLSSERPRNTGEQRVGPGND